MPFSIVEFRMTSITNLVNNSPEASAVVSPFYTLPNPNGSDAWESTLIELLEAQYLSATGKEHQIVLSATNDTSGFVQVTPPSAPTYEIPYTIVRGMSERDNEEQSEES